jgi:hypothetical protein
MNLEEAETLFAPVQAETASSGTWASDRWADFPSSYLSHHGQPCCDIAREWLVAMDFAQLNGADRSSGPRWLRSRYSWGPSSWPMHWCEVVKRKTIDCGAHAAISRALFEARGLTAFAAQLVQQYSKDATDQWRIKWAQDDVSCHWLDGQHIYHEATALLTSGRAIKLWDASSASWVDERQSSTGYGSLAALRVNVPEPHSTGGSLLWGNRAITPNRWNQLA